MNLSQSKFSSSVNNHANCVFNLVQRGCVDKINPPLSESPLLINWFFLDKRCSNISNRFRECFFLYTIFVFWCIRNLEVQYPRKNKSDSTNSNIEYITDKSVSTNSKKNKSDSTNSNIRKKQIRLNLGREVKCKKSTC